MWIRAQCLAYAAILLLAGCATVSPPPPPALSSGQPAFVLDGRIAVKFDSQHSSGGIRWAHDAESDDITMLAPLGITVAHVRRDAHGAVLEASGKRYAARNSDDLMQRALGWHLPLDGMPYWVRAQAMPGLPASVERDANGQISLLRQDGWAIHYTAYAAATADSLPRRMTMQREDMEIRLLIDEWKNN
jgi:outer membrane lipoprotein LolB